MSVVRFSKSGRYSAAAITKKEAALPLCHDPSWVCLPPTVWLCNLTNGSNPPWLSLVGIVGPARSMSQDGTAQ